MGSYHSSGANYLQPGDSRFVSKEYVTRVSNFENSILNTIEMFGITPEQLSPKEMENGESQTDNKDNVNNH